MALRVKGRNYTEKEKCILLNIIKKYPVIDSKSIDAVTIKQKSIAWEGITREFNATTDLDPRETDKLRIFYKNIKSKRRRELDANACKETSESVQSNFANITAVNSLAYFNGNISEGHGQFPIIDNSSHLSEESIDIKFIPSNITAVCDPISADNTSQSSRRPLTASEYSNRRKKIANLRAQARQQLLDKKSAYELKRIYIRKKIQLVNMQIKFAREQHLLHMKIKDETLKKLRTNN